MIFATDLDNTLIYSHKHMGTRNDTVCVEVKDGKEITFITKNTYEKLSEISKIVKILPVTTRSLAEYERIKFHFPIAYALVDNGGTLLVDGKIDNEWKNETYRSIEHSREEMDKIFSILKKDDFVYKERYVDNLFLFAKSDRCKEVALNLLGKINSDTVVLRYSGEKLYVLPITLTKENALERFINRFGEEDIIAAGDSEFDVGMVKYAKFSLGLAKPLFMDVIKEKPDSWFWEGEYWDYGDALLLEVEKRLKNMR